MIKGRWVGMVTIDFCFDESDYVPGAFEKMRDEVRNEVSKRIHALITKELKKGICTVTIEQQNADLYKVGLKQ